MKKLLLSSTMAAVILAPVNPALAARSDIQQGLLESGTFSAATITGTVVGGPAGFVIGAITGAFLANQTRVANEKSAEVDTMQLSVNDLESQIEQKQRDITKLEQQTINQLAFQVMFETGEDILNELDLSRVHHLARHLGNNTDLVTSLAGHADPRGTDEYNNVLAYERALAVKQALVDLGVEESRINVHGHGATYSSATQGNLDEYALERRVEIKLTNPKKRNSLVQH